MHEELKAFQSLNGHCRVPQLQGPLGKWVMTQIHQSKLLIDDKPSSMTKERMQKLNDIGFEWVLRETKGLDAMHEELKAFRSLYGHCRVPQLQGPLGTWVTTQIYQYKLLIDGKPSKITEKRIRKLSDIGFEWRVSQGRRRRSVRQESAGIQDSKS
jgi:hypothetical protein